MISIRQKQQKAFEALKGVLHITNPMQTPKITKVVVSVGTGSFKDKNKNKIVDDRLAKITGQKAVAKTAKKSVATFKVREGDLVGYQVTLRGARMFDFLDKLVDVALPRTKDFRGLSAGAIDDMGNYTIAVRENNVFPESADEELKDVFGMAVTIVTTAHDKAAAKALFDYLGFPFKKGDESKKGKK
ncbi:MAG: 50S ribosomal protein L5 [Patescibacteria group bacterium]|nr:50S ribosomal protein L5 [Patescibacteria group bacterium]MDE1945831.1 50S ribosomal protein L5 [Patescibacteria group bacterium]